MSLRPGQLRHLIVVEERITVQNEETGAVTTEWVEYGQAWAKIEPLSAREFMSAQALQSQISTRITMRRMDGLKASMRIVHGDQVYDIKGILADPVSGREYVTLPCATGGNLG